MTLRQTVNLVTLTFAFLLLAPTALILASWNSLPGDSLYSSKRSLEKLALGLLSPNYQVQSSLHTKLITRRLEEADLTIDKKSSSQGLEELKAQLVLAQTQVNAAPTPAAKQQASQQLVTALAQTQVRLETKKQTLIAAVPPQVVTPTIVRETVRTIYVTPLPTTPSPTLTPVIPTETPEEIIEDIEEVQEEINHIIEQAKDMSGKSDDHRQDENRGRSEDRRRNDKDNDQ